MLKRQASWLLATLLATGCAQGLDPWEGDDEPPQPEVEAELEPTGDSEILYAARVKADPVVDDHADELPVAEVEPEPLAKLTFAEAAAAPAWNSRVARQDAEPALAADLTGMTPSILLPQMRQAAGACTTPEFMTGKENLRLPDGTRLKAPATVFATATDARNYLRTVRAHMPMYLPYSHSDVRLGHGWIYNHGGSHRGQDYSRKDVPSGADPTFAIRAVAPGRVLTTYWGNAGNGVAIEHTAPDGFKFLTVYYHLRNGKDHDLAAAKALDCGDAAADSRCVKYKKFAENYSSHVSWGTNAHKLMVKAGDWVRGGQQLGWAGNTGPGGAGNGLNDDGSPKSARGNVHLHTYWGAQHPTEANTFIHIDPYGVYNKQSTDCYDLLEDTDFARVVAPFFENFHNLPVEVLTTYFNYYSAMGMSPRTLSVHEGSGLRASGSFQRGIPGSWMTRINMTEAKFQERFNEYHAKGLIPRETTVHESGSSARYTATFRPLLSGEGFDHRGRMTNSVWSQKWNSLVAPGSWRVADYFGYNVGGTDYQAALFTNQEARPFYLWRNQTFTNLKLKIEEGMKNGLAPVSVTAAELGGGTRYNVILKKQPGCWHWHVGLSKASYASVFSNMSQRGYRLEKLQGYDDGARYAAVFTLASGQAPAVCP
jgi:murein DD-endopeptidase MepM/ murein hydrolase activator NlpD